VFARYRVSSAPSVNPIRHGNFYRLPPLHGKIYAMAFFQNKRLFNYQKTANAMKSNEIAEDFRISSFSTK
jgi:hypothetical protein